MVCSVRCACTNTLSTPPERVATHYDRAGRALGVADDAGRAVLGGERVLEGVFEAEEPVVFEADLAHEGGE